MYMFYCVVCVCICACVEVRVCVRLHCGWVGVGVPVCKSYKMHISQYKHLPIPLVSFTVEPLQKFLQHLLMTIIGSKVCYSPATLKIENTEGLKTKSNHCISNIPCSGLH